MCSSDLELPAQGVDAVVEFLGELPQVVFLAILAGHAVLPAIDADVHLSHGLLTSIVRFEHEPDIFHGGIDPAGNVAVGGL